MLTRMKARDLTHSIITSRIYNTFITVLFITWPNYVPVRVWVFQLDLLCYIFIILQTFTRCKETPTGCRVRFPSDITINGSGIVRLRGEKTVTSGVLLQADMIKMRNGASVPIRVRPHTYYTSFMLLYLLNRHQLTKCKINQSELVFVCVLYSVRL